jgi:hypothetical protein
MGFVAAILRGKYIDQSEPPATGTPWWMNDRWTGNIFPLGSNSWVAHMKEEARQSAAWEADLPTIFHKTWQAENPDFLLSCTAGGCPPATVPPLPACPQTVVLCLALCPSLSGVSPMSLNDDLRAHLPILHSHENKRILMGTWCEQEDLMGTFWELDGKSSPHLFKKIRNIHWEHVCTTQLAHPCKN